MTEKIQIKIRKFRVQLDPPLEVFQVEVVRGDGVWDESCPSREHLDMFLKGVQAGSESYISLPEIPHDAEDLPGR